MDAAHEAHLQRLLDRFTADASAKYRRGQAEHNNNLWENPKLIDHAIEEAIDQVFYLYSLKEQLETSIKADRPVPSVDGPDGWSSGTLTPI